jgi:hypothetical protein
MGSSGLEQAMRLVERDGDRLFHDRMDASFDCHHCWREMALVVGRDCHCVERDCVNHRLGAFEDVSDGILTGNLTGARKIDVADCDKHTPIDELDRPSVSLADAAAADQPETHLFCHG